MRHFANFGLNQFLKDRRNEKLGANIGLGAGLLSGSGVFDTQEERDATSGIDRFNSLVGRGTLGSIGGGFLGVGLGRAGSQIGKAVELGKRPVYNYNRQYSKPHNPNESKGYTTVDVNPRAILPQSNYSKSVSKAANYGINPALVIGGGVLGGYVGGNLKLNREAEKEYDALDGYYFNNEGRIPDEQLLKTVTEREAALNSKYDNYRNKNNRRALIGTGVGLLSGLALSKGLNRIAPLS
jgi:hypothetical protein